MNDFANNRNAQIRRQMLEEFPDSQRQSQSKPWVNFRTLPTAAAYDSDFILRQWEILEQEGRVELKRLPQSSECAVNLTPLGWRSLEVSEDVWLCHHQNQYHGLTTMNSMTFTNSPVNNLTSVVASQGVSTTQVFHNESSQDVVSAINRLVEAIKGDHALTNDVKNDAVIEAEQMKGELQKSRPNASRISQALEWFKALTGAASLLPQIMDVAEKVKAHFP